MAAYFDPNDPQALIREINVLYKKLGITPPNLNAFLGDVDKLRDELEDVKDIWMDVNNGIGDVSKGFKAILDEVKNNNFTLNESKRSLTSLNSLTSQLRDQQLGINNLSAKELILMKQKADKNVATLKTNRAKLEAREAELTRQSTLTAKERKELSEILKVRANINGLLNDGESSLNILNGLLNKEIADTKKLEKQLGAVGGVLKGLGNIPILNNLIDFQEATLVAEKSLKAEKSSLYAMGATAKNLGGQLMESITSPATLIVGAFTTILNILKEIDTSSGAYAKSMNVTYSEALNVKEEMSSIAVSSNDISLTSTKLMETLSFVGKQLGMNAQLNKEDLVTMTKLREKAGFTNEELMGTLSVSLANGKSLKSNANSIVEATKNVNKQKGLFLNTKDILKDMSKVSAAITLSLGKNPTAIGNTIATAKALGIELSKLESIQQSLLNFESSIEAELSAELLVGKDLNLERARLLAMNNDLAGMAEEISNQFGTSVDFAKMNVIQQEAIAKAMGMGREELAQTLFTQDQLKGLSKDEASRREKILQQRISEVGLAQAQQELAKEGGLEQMEQQQSIAESFAQNISLLKEMATNLITALNPVLEVIQKILSSTNLVQAIFGAIAGVYVGKMLIGLKNIIPLLRVMKLESMAIAAADIAASVAKTFGAAAVPIILGTTAAIGAITAMVMKDGEIDPKKGPILSGDFGSVQLDPRDKAMYGADGTIKVGTDLLKETTPSKINTYNNTSTATTTIAQDNSALIAEIRSMRNELNNRPVVVHSVVKTENNDVLARGTNSSNLKSYTIQ